MDRQWTGFGASQDKSGALTTWTTILSFREDIPPSLEARAHSSLAKGWLGLAHGKGFATLDVDRLYNAGNSANEAVALGLVSGATLIVAESIKFAGLRRPEDNRERFEELTYLWKALDIRDAEVAEEKSKRDGKLSKDPLGYFCAAEDCGIMVTKKSTLRKCGGNCPKKT